MHADLKITNVNIATMAGGKYNLIRDGVVLITDGKLAWVGEQAALPACNADTVLDGKGALLTPGLIDCHTHIVYAGNRANEFEMRLQGVSYTDISRAGGGIASTVRATRAASAAELAAMSLPRIQSLLREGVTTLEIKTGYGLDLESEIAMLDAMDILAASLPVTVSKTFLGAHAVPPEYKGRTDAFVDAVCDMLPHLAPRIDAVDVFCENIGFNLAQSEKVFNAAISHGVPIKIHAEQLSNMGGAELAATLGALSADHLEYLDDAGIEAMAKRGTIAVLLPGSFYYLHETQKPPVTASLDAGVPIAVSTDANPGTSPVFSLLTAMNMACVLFGLIPEQALTGVTLHAAKALGMTDEVGSIEVGKHADLVLWDVQSPGELSYALGYTPCLQVIKDGRIVDAP